MPYCPECFSEFPDDLSECLNCKKDLVENLPEISEGEWVKLENMPGTVYAEMIQEVLEDNDIPSVIQREFMTSAYGNFGTGLPMTNSIVLVPKACYAEAEEILLSMFSDDLPN